MATMKVKLCFRTLLKTNKNKRKHDMMNVNTVTMAKLDPILNTMDSNDYRLKTTSKAIEKGIKELRMKLIQSIEHMKLKRHLHLALREFEISLQPVTGFST